jgi:hypothetical protein
MTRRRLAMLAVVLAAVLPYLQTLDDYFAQDDFGVVWLLSTKPAGFFPRWFVVPWMEDIWGDPPDEIRPFPAVSYQVAAVLGGAGSPVSNHVINVGFHAVNTFLVFRIAEAAAGLSLAPAAFAAVVFAILPMQTESVAWITGRVDSMPACFYLASFLLYVLARGRLRGSHYMWSVVLCFVALFTKQNAVTLPAALVLYDAIVARRPVRPTWDWMRPYLPFVLLTLGYLVLRYILFGEVAREGRLGAEYVSLFIQNLSAHLRRMVFGEWGMRLSGLDAALRVGVAAALVAAIGLLSGEADRASFARPAVYFLIVWIGIGLAPTLVAGYGSPRHVYLASVGWALALGVASAIVFNVRAGALRLAMRGIGAVVAIAVVAWYAVKLREDVRLWDVRAAVSRQVVVDLEREALAAPPGTLFIIDPPFRSWNFAVPFALRPPFAREDLTARVSIITHSSIHCCAANFWEPHTRKLIQAWMQNPNRLPVVALRWDADSGQMFRLRDDQDPFLRTVVRLLAEAKDVTMLDRLILNVSNGMVVKPALSAQQP